MADLQELFARLKATSSRESSESIPHSQTPQQQSQSQQPSIWAQPQQQQPSVSAPLFSPPASAMPTPSPAPQEQARTNNLLNLLKFNNSSGAGAPAGPMASLHNIGSGGGDNKPPNAPSRTASSSNQQDFLLNLLRKPNAAKPVQSAAPSSASEDTVVPSIEKASPPITEQSSAEVGVDASRADRSPTPARQFGSNASRETTPFAAPQPSTKANKFTYVNPFDQLHASSPLNRTPRPESAAGGVSGVQGKKMEILKHERDVSGPSGAGVANGAPAAKKTRKTEEGDKGSTQTQTVAEALGDVGEKVDREVGEALAEAVKKPAATAASATEPAIKRETAVDNEDVESSWESAEDSANDKKARVQVKVYNFPMKPFVTITLNPSAVDITQPIRQDDLMVIAQLKKEFDQMDRSLVTASQSYIVYAQTATKKDNAGFRIIRQDTGDHKQVFRGSGERVCNVQLCSSGAPGSDLEAVIGTGVNGTVFWTSLSKGATGEFFKEEDVEAQGFSLPAVSTAEEGMSGSTVKTRAKCSSRSPEFFAMSRSKMIYVVGAENAKEKAYCDPRTRVVDGEKFFAEHGLKINTGKAGKDFAFSEDDTVIASLDKSGVVKFWDITSLTEKARDESGAVHKGVELTVPLWTLQAVASGSGSKGDGEGKVGVSSIMLLDKERPHSKAVALRYMLVGFRQNHVLQLWDLGLGKAVQELRLPHERDSDGFCSINYHPKTGILAIGHPTRNSVYFVHLSAPKYNLPAGMGQVKYLTMLAEGGKGLPRPESTAIMSGVREASFSKIGRVRSVEMLRHVVESAGEGVEETVFEVYVVHERGVCAVPVRKADLGWSGEGKVVEGVDAVGAGVITVGPLDVSVPVVKEKEAASEVGSAVETPSKKKGEKKGAAAAQTSPAKAAVPSAPAATNGAQAASGSERKSMQIPEAPKPSESAPVNPPLMTPESYAKAAEIIKSPKQEVRAPVVEAVKEAAAPVKSEVANPSAAAAPVSGELQASLGKQFDSLYSKLDADKRIVDAATAARQDAMLRLVSSTLTENVEQSLHRIIGASIERDVVPAITDKSSKLIDAKLVELLPKQIDTSVQRELKAALPHALTAALKDQQVQRLISEATSTQVAQKVQQQVSNLLQQSLPNMAMQAMQKMVAEHEARTSQKLQEAETKRDEANKQVEQLSRLVTSLSQTIQGMADSQAAFQEQILKAQRERSTKAESSKMSEKSAVDEKSEVVEKVKTAEEMEVERITQLLMEAEFEQATIAWLQSPNQAALFDNLFVRVNPEYLKQVTPLVALSVSAALTASLDTSLGLRLEWLETVLGMIDVRDEEIVDVAPKIMDVLMTRLQGAFMIVHEQSGWSAQEKDGLLRRISALNKTVIEIRRMTG
ncbi:hypothetical protein LTR56_014084 [Elasticomyces elasticus]|nr:hypothetical protein LTR22_020000 [Elasticomyces elasticus]KAK3636611.1 hypothetical protein LTR56_014084 [Elasticomyces elasticus]KAK4910917.1 hypothetical protein LTR49_020443 [Elasticomyces elasticus]KAK5760002.1 hypothetical protein LTS12_009898 [Elasticomyces elasticus]